MRIVHSIATLMAVATSAHAYGVGPALSLEELANKADLVCKATAIADRAGVDPWFEKLTGFDVRVTELRIVSCRKGSAPKTIQFEHYAPAPTPVGISYSPQHYRFKIGRTYVVFASSIPQKPGIARQLFKSHTMKEDQGLVMTADDKPLQGATVTEAIRAEIVKLLASTVATDAAYGIRQLDDLSGGGFAKLKDFERPAALAELRPLVLSKDNDIATAAITVFGGDSPYFVESDAPYWLAGMGQGTISGLSPRKPPATRSATAAASELTTVAATNSKLRALAIRALGRARAVPAATLRTWFGDPDPEVRRAVVLISAELPDHSLIVNASSDQRPEIRRAAALAAGFAQDAKLLPGLGRLLDDADGKVREAAAMAVLSFRIDLAATLLTAKLSSEFGPLFVNALARKNPQPYLAQLGEVIEKHLQPAQWWGGSIPAGDSWTIVFDYVKARPPAELTAGTLDKSLDSLERMQWFSSSQPRDLYALYVRRTLTTRAKQFRTALKKTVSYSMDPYLDEADKFPERFVP